MEWRLIAKSAGRAVHDVDGVPLSANAAYLDYVSTRTGDQRLHYPWLRLPFGKAIFFEARVLTQEAEPLVKEALNIIAAWCPGGRNDRRHNGIVAPASDRVSRTTKGIFSIPPCFHASFGPRIP